MHCSLLQSVFSHHPLVANPGRGRPMPHHYLFLLQRRGLMQAVAGTVLCTFTWLLVHPTLLAAQTLGQRQALAPPSLVNEDVEFSEALAKIEGRLTKLH